MMTYKPKILTCQKNIIKSKVKVTTHDKRLISLPQIVLITQ